MCFYHYIEQINEQNVQILLYKALKTHNIFKHSSQYFNKFLKVCHIDILFKNEHTF